MIRVLAIGNSFSENATHYLHQLAQADGVDLLAVNLFIGGCELKRHWENIVSGERAYRLEINGHATETPVSVSEALAMEDWDYIVTQQASHDSGHIETYEPYLSEICAWLRGRCPRARLLLHETWAYETDSTHPRFADYHYDQREMYEKLAAAYRREAERNGMTLIPCGDVIQRLRAREPFLYGHGGMSLCSDGFHMNVIYGRYLLAGVWYRVLTGRKLRGNAFIPHTYLSPEAICDEKVLAVVRDAVDEDESLA